MSTISANGTSTFYRREGEGTPVWLLHGGLEDGRDWEWLFNALITNWTVTLPDRRGHGRTPDVEGEFTYRLITDDVIAAIEAMETEPVTIVGFSDGAIIALELAGRRADLVRSVVAISGNMTADGLDEVFLPRLANPEPDAPRLAPIRDAYGEVSPDGIGHWSMIYTKMCACGLAGPGLTTADLASIAAPTLLICGDDDAVTLEHAVEMFRALSSGQLAVLPGTTHVLGHEKPDLLQGLVKDFLTDPEPNRLYPMRTAR